MRVTSPVGKLGVALASLVVSILAGAGVGLGIGPHQLAGPVALTVWAIAVVLMTRVFRGPSEELAPRRAWWRATERSGIGVLLAVTFGASAFGALLTSDYATWVRIYAFSVNVALAIWYALSSWMLSRRSAGDHAADTPRLVSH